MCVCVYVCMGVWVYVYVCMCVCVYVCMSVCVYGCMGVWVYELELGPERIYIPCSITICPISSGMYHNPNSARLIVTIVNAYTRARSIRQAAGQAEFWFGVCMSHACGHRVNRKRVAHASGDMLHPPAHTPTHLHIHTHLHTPAYTHAHTHAHTCLHTHLVAHAL